MRVAVTGAAGHVGPFVLDELLRHGHEPVAVDLRPAGDDRVEWVSADVEDVDALERAFAGCRAVVHLAAVRAPGIEPPEVTYRVNTQGTICGLEAAVRVGARRFVLASSDSAFGFCFQLREMTPDYLPLDEDHPARPQDCYGLSKIAAEEICRSYTRGGSISTVCLRTCDVWYPAREYALEAIADERRKPQRQALWVYVHALDVARAYRVACEATGIEHETLLISAHDTEAFSPTARLLEEFYPRVPLRCDLAEHGALVSGVRARERLGFEPERSWRDDIDSTQVARLAEARTTREVRT
jgi:nucleoside-diphosphate-sugar epimerase